MIESIYLFPDGALQESTMSALGKINVVCGRNNSGKSTVLRAILNPPSRRLGRRLTGDDVGQVCQHLIGNGTVFLQNGTYTELGNKLSGIIQEVANTRDTWFAGARDFSQEVVTRYNRYAELRYYHPPFDHLDEIVDRVIAPSPVKTVLVPPRRSMEENVGMNLGVNPESNGHGLLNHLFYCQTQFEGTPLRALADETLQAFENVSGGFSYRIVPGTNNSLNLNFVTPNGTLASASQCGQGLQDLMILLFFAISDTGRRFDDRNSPPGFPTGCRNRNRNGTRKPLPNCPTAWVLIQKSEQLVCFGKDAEINFVHYVAT
jgi:hypothetical protein